MTDLTPPPQVWPTLRANDAPALIRFLVDVLGFQETFVAVDAGVVQHAQLSWPQGGGIMLGSSRSAPDDPWALTPGTCGAYVVTDEPDALYQRLVDAGVEIIMPIYDSDHGSRDFSIRDPEGNRWAFGTYRGEPRRG